MIKVNYELDIAGKKVVLDKKQAEDLYSALKNALNHHDSVYPAPLLPQYPVWTKDTAPFKFGDITCVAYTSPYETR